MIQNGTAGDCAYAETNRRKPRSCLWLTHSAEGRFNSFARIKSDNAGRLEQQVRDAFTLVNYNGKAFRDARITEQFLESRLEELKWGVKVQDLLAKSRQEQREAKEQREGRTLQGKLNENFARPRKIERCSNEHWCKRRSNSKQPKETRKSFTRRNSETLRQNTKMHLLRKNAANPWRNKPNEAQSTSSRTLALSAMMSTNRAHSTLGSNDRVAELGGASVPFEFDVHAMLQSDNAPELEHRLHKTLRVASNQQVNHQRISSEHR